MNNEIKISIPTSWEDIKLKDFQRYYKIEEPTSNDMLEVFLGLNSNHIRTLEAGSVNELIQSVSSVLSLPTEHLKLIHRVDNYGLIPNMDKMSYGEYLDLTEWLKDWDNMNMAMEVLYREVIEEKTNKKGLNQYLIEKYDTDKVDGIRGGEMTMDVVFSVVFFFQILTEQLLIHTPNYIKREMETKEWGQQQDLTENGEDTNRLLLLLQETLDESKKLHNFQFINA